MRFGASLILLLAFGPSHDCAAQAPFALGAPRVAHAAPPARSAHPSAPETASTHVEHGAVLPEIDSALARRLRAIVDAHPNRRNDVFAKMGGSSVESRAFLHCLGTDQVLLDENDELLETISYFRRGRAGGSDPFRRESLAARVGWSVRHGMGGRPPWILQEIDAISPRWAFLFFGGNDVEGRDPRRYAERLTRVVDGLLSRGVIPILGAVAPRRDRPDMDRWVRAYNDVARAIADAWQVPYIDFYQAFTELPGLGLAGDGVHPNVFRRGGSTRPCDFSEPGIDHGFNLRNLLSLRMLDVLRRSVLGRDAGAASDPTPILGEGTARAPFELPRAPFARRVDSAEARSSVLREYVCGDAPAFAGEGPEVVARVRFAEPRRIRLAALGDGGRRAFVAVLGADATPTHCIAGAMGEVEIDVGPGVHHVVIELPQRDRGHALFSIDVADGLSAPLTRPHDRARLRAATATR